MKKRSALGNGVNSLFSSSFDNEMGTTPSAASSPTVDEPSQLLSVALSSIQPNLSQPRKIFNDDDLDDLARSIEEMGVIQPIIVKRDGETESFMIVAGERRWRAAQKAGLEEIPIIIKSCDDEQMLEIALIENIQRENLNVIEEAEAYQQLQKKYHLNQEEISKKVGKDRSTITNTLRILRLPAELQKDLIDSTLTMGHARALLSIPDSQTQIKLRNVIIDKKLNVRQTEKLIRDYLAPGKKNSAASSESNPNLLFLSDNLQKHFGTKVQIAKRGEAGKVSISFCSYEDLERILELMNIKK